VSVNTILDWRLIMHIRSFRSSSPRHSTVVRYVPTPHVVAVVQDTDTALLNVATERYYTLDAVGTRIWELLQGGADIAAISRRLADEYDAPLETITADAREFLAALAHAGLVRSA
jgi:hypothetical protein